jgi:sphingosine kinase/serine/threonine-protein phosphatase 2B regulatory subunit
MGNAAIPVPDDRMNQTMATFGLEKKHIVKLWAKFQKHDKDRSGTIDVEEFYAMMKEKKSIFGESIFELIDSDNDGVLDFSEFVTATATYIMFGPDDILKFCFFIFDKDKNGYIEEDELEALVMTLHAEANANVFKAMSELDTDSDGKIDFREFRALNSNFPQVLFPAYRMQEHMMENTLGTKFWKEQKIMFQNQRHGVFVAEEKERAKKAREEKQKARKRLRNVMGWRYWLCPCKRKAFMKKLAPLDEDESDFEEVSDDDGSPVKKAKITNKSSDHRKKRQEMRERRADKRGALKEQREQGMPAFDAPGGTAGAMSPAGAPGKRGGGKPRSAAAIARARVRVDPPGGGQVGGGRVRPTSMSPAASGAKRLESKSSTRYSDYS